MAITRDLQTETRCNRCWQSAQACFCNDIHFVPSSLQLLVLQHPTESRNPYSTARLLSLSLESSVHRVGLSWPSLSKALGNPAINQQWGVLYLGAKKEENRVLSQGRVHIIKGPDVSVTFKSLKGIVVLDGNWKQAKTLWWRNPWLLRLHRLVLNAPQTSSYGLVRRQPRRPCLSTLESVAVCVSEITGRHDIEPLLIQNQERFLKKILATRSLYKAKPDLGQQIFN